MTVSDQAPDTFRGRDGRVLVRRLAKGVCQRCEQEFEFKMTTRPCRYCTLCAPILELERRRNGHKAQRARRAARRLAPKLQQKIPSAGFDPSERPLDSYERQDSL